MSIIWRKIEWDNLHTIADTWATGKIASYCIILLLTIHLSSFLLLMQLCPVALTKMFIKYPVTCLPTKCPWKDVAGSVDSGLRRNSLGFFFNISAAGRGPRITLYILKKIGLTVHVAYVQGVEVPFPIPQIPYFPELKFCGDWARN